MELVYTIFEYNNFSFSSCCYVYDAEHIVIEFRDDYSQVDGGAQRCQIDASISATYKDGEDDKVTAELQAVAYFYSAAKEMYVHVETSTAYDQLGENVIIHLRSYFAFQVYSYVVSCLSISSKFLEMLFLFLKKCKFVILAGRVERSGHPSTERLKRIRVRPNW